jgi:undecaprenyl-diphosphatase
VLQEVQRGFVTNRWWLIGLAAISAVVYATLWFGWALGWSWVLGPDASTLAAAHRIGVEHHGWVTLWNAWCTVFSPVSFRVLALGLIAYALKRRQPRVALFLFVSIELSALVTEGAKRLADRPRPDTALVFASSTSFPSGHALGSMVAVLALAVVLLPLVRRDLRPWAMVVGAVIVLSVGIGRVALNVHHLSDVVAGWALGYLYFAVCLLILPGAGVTAADETPAVPDSGP